jgi:hypothetical protein
MLHNRKNHAREKNKCIQNDNGNITRKGKCTNQGNPTKK